MVSMNDKKKIAEHLKLVLSQAARTIESFSVTGAVLFGSVGRGTQTKDSDADLLVVAEGLNARRNRRGSQIAQIKSLFPKIPLDILLLTREEVISNFKNHNPLFLDIALEGLILLDPEDFLSRLMVETKTYIRTKRIRRFGDGWAFPVRRGVAVPL
jgi:predicted nucleotidyltransferase